MGRRKAVREKVPNQCVDHDVRLPTVRPAPQAPARASDLSEGQVYLLAEQAARQGGHPADRIRTLFGFDPTDDDRAHVEWVVGLHPEWAPHLDLARRHQTTRPAGPGD